ncbi:3,4-dihydroxy-2-butanone-4-phosphate synthase [uncultured Albimonas sp.]|uniref:3,4-dihydroxy-2-butanone-4-phosphate synthase n=1 Tax=uncultured Albimonas sp. TaxID=1331701 RepID=UPI0030ECAF96|tara:strand:+ start:16072 stop:17205 length:1134 start_codon:yes stop_codon:yes gene_type:complete
MTLAVRTQQVEASGLSPIEAIIAEARAGRPFILVDAEDRENEGDVVIPADAADAGAITFMALHARGLICLALDRGRVETLRLAPQPQTNRAGRETAFTVSIEAREGVTTGISAADRARTIAAAIAPGARATDLASPGHVFPLIARDGGVLVRAGHTEAAVDIARLAGRPPAGVICEIMNEDGSMARLPQLRVFAEQHGLKIGAIADLIAFRRRTERHLERVHRAPFPSRHGDDFTLHVFRHRLDGSEHVALTRGPVGEDPERPVLARMHQIDLAADLLGHAEAREDYVGRAMRAIAKHDGPAALVFVHASSPTWISDRIRGLGEEAARSEALRDYGVGAQILRELGARRLELLTSSEVKPAAIEGYGLSIVARRPVD